MQKSRGNLKILDARSMTRSKFHIEDSKILVASVQNLFAFYANKTLFKSSLVSRKSKLKLYWSVIRPISVYGCETWVLKESIIQKLSVFERKILRKIFGPTEGAKGIWRIKTNKELDELIKYRNIINYVKTQRLSWFGQINKMPETSTVKRIHK